MSAWGSYCSIYNLGHRAIVDLLKQPVIVEEKIDGSQFSFMLTEEGEIKVRSKGAVMITDAPERMFTQAVETVKELAPKLRPGWVYRGEYLRSPKHNTLAYNRVPAKHIILFDINDGLESYLPYDAMKLEANALGLEVVPLLYRGMVEDASKLRELLDRESILGGQKIEGMVIKPAHGHEQYGLDKKLLMGKFVSEAFKEIHQGVWKQENPTAKDIIEQIALDLTTPARWNKALQHLTEAGKLEGTPKDIGALIKEVPGDIEKECREEIEERLYKFAWPHIRRKVTAGLPEWYKEQLLKRQFEGETA